MIFVLCSANLLVMILKGSTVAGVKHARQFARHLVKEENSIVEVWESIMSEGTRKEIEADLVDMQLLTSMTRGRTGIFHIAISPREEEEMSKEEWQQAVNMAEGEFELNGQFRMQVYHEKKGRPHLHVFWSLVDMDKNRLIPLRYYKRRLQRLADEMELEFGHKRTRRFANESTLEITNADRLREGRTKKSAKARKQLISKIWQKDVSPQKTIANLQSAGYVVVQGDRCRYALIDREGEVYNLTRELPKLIKQKDVHARLGELYQDLPTLAEEKERRARAKEATLVANRERIKQQMERIQVQRGQDLARGK